MGVRLQSTHNLAGNVPNIEVPITANITGERSISGHIESVAAGTVYISPNRHEAPSGGRHHVSGRSDPLAIGILFRNEAVDIRRPGTFPGSVTMADMDPGARR